MGMLTGANPGGPSDSPGAPRSVHPRRTYGPSAARGVPDRDRSTAAAPGEGPSGGAGLHPVTPRKATGLDVSRFVVLGESLAAGIGNFSLSADSQSSSFPAQMARRMGVPFPQQLFQPPGIGSVPGWPELPVILPAYMQTTVFRQLPPPPVSNLSIPRGTLSQALNTRPCQPLIHRKDNRQTACNLILGVLGIARGAKRPLPTQLEYALERSPTFAVIELGYAEALEAAVGRDPRLLPGTDEFRSDYDRLLAALTNVGCSVLVLTVPDPFTTAFYAPVKVAARILRTEPDFLTTAYDIPTDAWITLPGLNAISYQIFARSLESLPTDAWIPRAEADRIRQKVRTLNKELAALSATYDALLYDLCGMFERISTQCYRIGGKALDGRHLGGFYNLNGFYPGATGQALIANELLSLLNRKYGTAFPPIDLGSVLLRDPAADFRRVNGATWKTEDLLRYKMANPASVIATAAAEQAAASLDPTFPVPEDDEFLTEDPGSLPLTLPPGLEQVLLINAKRSYFGDGIAAKDCRDTDQVRWGGCGSTLFGGLSMVDSPLEGRIRIRFTPPVGGHSRFTVAYCGGFKGQDAVLSAPLFFRMPFRGNRVDEVPGLVSSGVLNLLTGEVTDLRFFAQFKSEALGVLVTLNPTFPKQPLSFPGEYGSAWARFEPRDDGKLDFTFYGSTFVPLGRGIRWPLNIHGPDGDFATVPANGTVMHPHLHLTTVGRTKAARPGTGPDLHEDTVEEFTLHTRHSAFGDAFHLAIPELGGPATGRSHVLGRIQIQFGPKCGDLVPLAVSLLNPGGLLDPLPDSPVIESFPAGLPAGPIGFYELLRFPLRTYALDELAIMGDPFDIAMGVCDSRTGDVIVPHLHRGFINQDLIYALLRLEPRTPKSSFLFRGPARFETRREDQLLFRFKGTVRVPYPQGFRFPQANLTTAFTVDAPSVLDPFLWLRATRDGETAGAVMQGHQENIEASIGERFSFRYKIGGDTKAVEPFFEYVNHTQKGTYRLHSLAWLGFSNTRGSRAKTGRFDTVTFAGFGIWSKDGYESLQVATVQICTAPDGSYVGIQIGASDVSNVNTRPEYERDAFP